VLSSILERAHYDVMASTDGHEAWTELAADRIDLVITDREMPAMNGLELLRAVRQSPRHGGVPVIMLTGTTLESAGDEADAEGASAFLTKPVSSRELLEIVERLLRETAAGRARQLVTAPERRACLQGATRPLPLRLRSGKSGRPSRSVVGDTGGDVAPRCLASASSTAASSTRLTVTATGRGGALMLAGAIVRRAPSPPLRPDAPTPDAGDVPARVGRRDRDDARSRRRVGRRCRHLPRRFVAVKPGHPAYHRW
jgi:two-component system chemotaxis response regulator CheY